MDAVRLDDFPTSNDPTAPLAHCAASTCCLPITVFPIPGEGEIERDLHPTPRIFVAHDGSGRRWYQLGARTRELHTAPRMIEIYEGGLSFDHCQWEGEAGRCVMVEFADADVQAMTHGELQRLELRTRHELFDERISGITLELAEEALNGLPNGRLYAQGLCVALIGALATHHAPAAHTLPVAASAGRFGPPMRRRLADMIGSNLGADLSLARLADEAGLSVHHFVRVFKATFGTTPHRYVQQRRLEAAVAALQRQGRRSIADIALDHGFASQAHMTDLMRRHLGVTPRSVRQRE